MIISSESRFRFPRDRAQYTFRGDIDAANMPQALKVNCLIVGAQKSGTTALARFLGEHREICMAPRKELHVFDAPDYEDRPDFCDQRYARAFPNYHGQRWIIEATPAYLYLPSVAERIHRYNPDVRLIAILRNPVERALSHYSMEVSRRAERLPFYAAFAAEPFRLWRDGKNFAWTSSVRVHSYLDRGFYSIQLQRLIERFSREQILALKTDDLRHHHVETLERVYTFLEIERPPCPPEPRYIRPLLGEGVVERPVEVPPLVRALLRQIYRNEITRLEHLLGWQLDEWR